MKLKQPGRKVENDIYSQQTLGSHRLSSGICCKIDETGAAITVARGSGTNNGPSAKGHEEARDHGR